MKRIGQILRESVLRELIRARLLQEQGAALYPLRDGGRYIATEGVVIILKKDSEAHQDPAAEDAPGEVEGARSLEATARYQAAALVGLAVKKQP